jgi:hypothetical protein
MRTIKIRLAGPQDLENIAEWSAPHREDLERYSYPTATILASENGRPIQYGLVTVAAMLEGLAPNPEAKSGDLALGLRGMIEEIRELCRKAGIKELYAVMSETDGSLKKLAKNNGWEEIPHSLWRLKV